MTATDEISADVFHFMAMGDFKKCKEWIFLKSLKDFRKLGGYIIVLKKMCNLLFEW